MARLAHASQDTAFIVFLHTSIWISLFTAKFFSDKNMRHCLLYCLECLLNINGINLQGCIIIYCLVSCKWGFRERQVAKQGFLKFYTQFHISLHLHSTPITITPPCVEHAARRGSDQCSALLTQHLVPVFVICDLPE